MIQIVPLFFSVQHGELTTNIKNLVEKFDSAGLLPLFRLLLILKL